MPRAKNNLSTFDIDQIEADLMAVEAEALKLDPHSERSQQTVVGDNSETEKTAAFKPHSVNVVNFNPDSSKLLHKVLRTNNALPNTPENKTKSKKPRKERAQKQKSRPEVNASRQAKVDVSSNDVVAKDKKPRETKVAVSNASNRSSVGGMDGFKKPAGTTASAAAKSMAAKPLTISRPVNMTSVALTGMRRANQFNRFALEQHKTSLQNQIEKQSLFERSLDDDREVFDQGLQTNGAQKVYNKGGKKGMLGGVDQHNLGPGKARRFLGTRPMRLLMPVLGIFLVGAWITYLNMPSINVKIAESKSGVAVSEPSYTPEGYKLTNNIEADTGQVAMNFKNGNQAYSVVQKVSDWDSKALLENKILKETKEYSAYTDRGLTIYVYDGKAVWVNQGKVYEIELDGSKLETEEMIRIAGSM